MQADLRSTALTGSDLQTPGMYISAVGHVGLIGWLILGWGFNADPLPFEVTEVSMVTADEFAALTATSTPDPGDADPATPTAPVVEDAPETPQSVEPPAPVETPEAVEPPAQEAPPPEPPEPPEPPAELTKEVPALVVPEQTASPDLTVSERPKPRPAPRIAPQPVEAPEPDTNVADVAQEAVVPDAPDPAEVVEEPAEAQAPQEAATEITTAVDEPSGAVTTSPRPASRPKRPAPQTSSASSDNAATEPDTSAEDAAVAAALADALAAAAPAAPQGPPMTGAETEGFRLAVNRCWNVDLGSESARVEVTVSFELSRDGKVSGPVRKVAAAGGSNAAIEAAFQAARRAILRCGAAGYDLPADKYEHWKEVEITFDPSGMRFQ